ncbi:hypothetical protein [Alkalihalobacillus sp. 1P02AB]|uniref:hypothetical protein n=1 Tax=Alkalihalobacillus sp. 1P02AB TaxID=3132260 RepID=UPI0039A4B854
MSDKKKHEEEAHTEGREEFFMDIDRMINEGLGGGTVNEHHSGKIEQARELEKESPPNSKKD